MPALMRLLAVVPLEIAPWTVRVFAVTVTVREVPAEFPSETAPAPRSRLWLPAKVKLAFHVCGLLVVRTRFAAPLSSLPPLMVSMPVPSADHVEPLYLAI